MTCSGPHQWFGTFSDTDRVESLKVFFLFIWRHITGNVAPLLTCGICAYVAMPWRGPDSSAKVVDSSAKPFDRCGAEREFRTPDRVPEPDVELYRCD